VQLKSRPPGGLTLHIYEMLLRRYSSFVFRLFVGLGGACVGLRGTFECLFGFVESILLVARVVLFCCGAMCFGRIIVFRCGFVMRVVCHFEFSLNDLYTLK
jgi:hypothetical protein